MTDRETPAHPGCSLAGMRTLRRSAVTVPLGARPEVDQAAPPVSLEPVASGSAGSGLAPSGDTLPPGPARIRELLGIVYCPSERCSQDTIPHDLTGRCMFCDRKLVFAPVAPPVARPCGICGTDLPEGRRKYCGEPCRVTADNRDRTNRRARARTAA